MNQIDAIATEAIRRLEASEDNYHAGSCDRRRIRAAIVVALQYVAQASIPELRTLADLIDVASKKPEA